MADAVRRAAWRAGADNGWHEDLVWYAAAVHQMRLRTPGWTTSSTSWARRPAASDAHRPAHRHGHDRESWSDPLGLGYQSQVHGTFVPIDAWPSVGGQRARWLECAHNHWFFLPWHRAYLLEYEAVARRHIADLGGPADEWGLPYWNYSDFADDPDRLGLPLPLRGASLPDDVTVPGVDARPDGSFPNPLFIPVRTMQGEPLDADPGGPTRPTLLLRPHYANQQDAGAVSFGGGVLEEPGNQALFHDRSREIGQLDMQPHGAVHMQVHGAMSRFQTAGLDPVFWMHHCNVDRLWETYARDLGHGYPFENGAQAGTAAHQSWVDADLHVPAAGRVRRGVDARRSCWTSRRSATPTTRRPRRRSRRPADAAAAASRGQPFGLDVPVPEPVSAAAEVVLARRTTEVRLGGGDAGRPSDDRRPRSRPRRGGCALRRHPQRVAGADLVPGLPRTGGRRRRRSREDAAHYVGLLSLFGVYEASRDDGTSPGDGQRRQLDVTAQVRAQAADAASVGRRGPLVACRPATATSGRRPSWSSSG